MKNFTTLIFVALLLSTPAMAGKNKSKIRGQDGGGGGGIEINGTVISLAEAGLQITTAEDETEYLDRSTIEATARMLERVESILPMSDKATLRELAFGSDHKYKKLAVVNPDLFEKIREEYAKQVGAIAKQDNFKLVAYTDESMTTYLLPEWETASLETRALFLLTHEAPYFKNPKFDLGKILNLEGAVHEFNQAPANPERMLAVYKALVDLEIVRATEKQAFYRGTYLQESALTNRLTDYYLHTLALKQGEIKLGNIFSKQDTEMFVRGFVGILQSVRYPLRIDTIELNRLVDPKSDFFKYLRGQTALIHTRDYSFEANKHMRYCPNARPDSNSRNALVDLSESEIQDCMKAVRELRIQFSGDHSNIVDANGNVVDRILFLKTL